MKQSIQYYSRWILLSTLIGILCGLASAVFLLSLEAITAFRDHHTWLLYGLPLGGLFVGLAYHRFGRRVEAGNNLIIDRFHDPQAIIPLRMTPLVLLGTLLTHLFGGSAGREGTAVQMGGSIADQLTLVFKISKSERRTLLMAGMSGGFGSVFGVPFAGTIFGLEVLTIGRLQLWAIIECAVSAIVAHMVCLACGVHHTQYLAPEIAGLTPVNVGVSLVAGFCFGGAARLFVFVYDKISGFSKRQIPFPPWRAMTGGALISILYYFLPILRRYAGLGVPFILSSLQEPVAFFDWFGKLSMTALTLGSGFKGGEVTPLLFVGSTLGNALAQVSARFLPDASSMSLPLLASMGLVGVFAGAANTPFACTVMAMELFGPGVCVYAAIACFASYAASGHHGIYHAQRIHIRKEFRSLQTLEFFRALFRRPDLDKKPGDKKRP